MSETESDPTAPLLGVRVMSGMVCVRSNSEADDSRSDEQPVRDRGGARVDLSVRIQHDASRESESHEQAEQGN